MIIGIKNIAYIRKKFNGSDTLKGKKSGGNLHRIYHTKNISGTKQVITGELGIEQPHMPLDLWMYVTIPQTDFVDQSIRFTAIE